MHILAADSVSTLCRIKPGAPVAGADPNGPAEVRDRFAPSPQVEQPGATAGMIGPGGAANPAPIAPEPPPIPTTPAVDLLPVPDTRQSTDYSCGASALQAVLMYWGLEYREDELMKLLGTTENGTNPRDIVRVARELGLEADLRETLTLSDLEASVREGVPVIIAAQAWREGEDLNRPWSEVWESGHYMVVIGLDKQHVYLEDPSILGGRGVIPRREFEERWHDIDEKPYLQSGIFIRGSQPAPPPPLMYVA